MLLFIVFMANFGVPGEGGIQEVVEVGLPCLVVVRS